MTDIKFPEIVIEYSDDEGIEEKQELTQYSYFSGNRLCFEYFVGFEVAALLGYTNTKSVIKNNVSKCNQLPFREYPGVKIPSLNPKTILITYNGVCELLLKTRKRISPDVVHILKKFGIETTNKKCLTKEQQTLSGITNVFKTEEFVDQYPIGKYYLDLYFPVYRLIIECDENGHADRRPGDERERMDFVNKELQIDDSNWIRFNPDEKDFDISRVIGRIYTSMKMKGPWKRKYIEPNKKKKNINLDPEKPCNMCNIVKPLTEFNSAREHRDGRENVCTICRRARQEEILLEKKKEIEEKGIEEITCNICKETMQFDKFYKDKNSPTGHMRRCKECHKYRLKKLEKKDKIMVDEKECSICKVTKPVEDFHKRISSRDGYNIYCKECACKKCRESAKKKKV